MAGGSYAKEGGRRLEACVDGLKVLLEILPSEIPVLWIGGHHAEHKAAPNKRKRKLSSGFIWVTSAYEVASLGCMQDRWPACRTEAVGGRWCLQLVLCLDVRLIHEAQSRAR